MNPTTKAMVMKAKINKWNHIQLKSFYMVKETTNKIKMQPIEWEKIFANHIYAKGLIFKICKEQMQLSKKNPINLIKK